LNYYQFVPAKVTVKDPGQVTLQGEVRSYAEKLNISNIVSRVKGVKGITDNIVVKPDVAGAMVTDNEIKISIENDLKVNSVILAPNEVKVAVKSGMVTLTGTVNNHNEYEMAEQVAGEKIGVKGLDDKLQILSTSGKTVPDAEILALVKDIVADHFPQSGKNVQVKVASGQVTLSGSVERLWEKHVLGKEVRKLIGVKGVVNDLVVF
jgi:osmotically-inducible protein OsmY